MTRLTQLLLLLTVYAAAALLLHSGRVVPVTPHQQFYIKLSPLVLVALFGIYSIATIVKALVVLEDRPDKRQSLDQEVADAKAFYSKHKDFPAQKKSQ